MPSDDDIRRFGSLVPIRLYRSAVGRNYARRRLREHFRRNKQLFPDRTQTLVRLYAAPKDWERFFRELERLLSSARTRSKQGMPSNRNEGSDR